MSTTDQRRTGKERFWRRMLRQWRSSRLSVRAFCAHRQISEPNFYAWRRAIAQRDGQAARFVPAGEASSTALELLLDAGRVLRIGRGFDGPTLRRLLALLEEGQP